VTEIIIVCKARSHQRRPQMIARFRDVGGAMWDGVPLDAWEGDTVSTRVGMRHKSTLQFLDGDEPSDGGQYPANSGYRLRYRFECGMCGDVKVERGENLFDKFNRLRAARPDNDTHVIPLHIF
jgi:hypothetical protein